MDLTAEKLLDHHHDICITAYLYNNQGCGEETLREVISKMVYSFVMENAIGESIGPV